MPIYEYHCTACGKDFEKMQKITENPIQECPFCLGKVRKLISSTSFHLKGTGWYVTDYAKKSGGASGEAPKKAESKENASGSGDTSSSSASGGSPKESS